MSKIGGYLIGYYGDCSSDIRVTSVDNGGACQRDKSLNSRTIHSMNTHPLVSIIIPAYKATWFEIALQSALQQDYPHCEIIIGDDCPTTQIKDIVAHHYDTSPFPVDYVRHEAALGEVANLAACIQRAQGEFIKFLYDDDVIFPQAISQQVAALIQTPAAVMVTARRERIDTTGAVLDDDIFTVSPVMEDTLFHGQDMARFQADSIINFIGEPSSVMIRTAALRSLLVSGELLTVLAGEQIYYLADLVIYLRVLRQGHLLYLNQVLSQFRISVEQSSQTAREDGSVASASHVKFSECIKTLGWYDTELVQGTVRVAPRSDAGNFSPLDVSAALQNALTASHFACWLRKRSLRPGEQQLIAAHLAQRPDARIAIVIDTRNCTAQQWQTTLDSVEQSVPGLTLHPIVLAAPRQTFISREIPRLELEVVENPVTALNQLLEQQDFDWLLLLQAGSQFFASGLHALGSALPAVDHCQMIYADEVYPVQGRLIGASFRPDFNLDLLLSFPARMAKHWLYRRQHLQQLGGFSAQWPESFELDAILRTIESQPFQVIGHLPEPLIQTDVVQQPVEQEQAIIRSHLQRRGYPQATVKLNSHNVYQLSYAHAQCPLVSIIIVVENNLANLATCVTSVLEKTTSLNYELLLIAAEGGQPAQEEWLNGIATVDAKRIHVLRMAGKVHRAAMVNAAARQASGDYLLILSSDIAVMNSGWLDGLLNHAQRPEVGIVGGKQLYANGIVRHAGYILGINGFVGEPFFGESNEQAGHMARLQSDQNYSAVSGDLMMIRRECFNNVGGFDEQLHYFDDVDFCLRVRETGLMTVWTPYVRTIRYINPRQEMDKSARDKEEDRLLDKWQGIVTQDPAYNLNLTLNNINFNISSDSELTWRPLAWRPVPVVVSHMADFAGCGYYRIIKPFEAMREANLLDGKLSSTLLNVVELNRYQADSLIFQRRIDSEFHEWLAKISKHNHAFKIYELDDYLPNIPLKNHHRHEFSNDVKKMMRRTLSYMDRFVVSTAPLAEAFKDLHHDIVVMPNRLSRDWWGKLQSLRNQGKKPRVGWAGGSSHTGDLEMIVDLMRHFADEVEWIFFGMCPPKLRPWLHEYHHGVEIKRYPAKLASLNLDLALAPVEDNFFNTCKSNLRLLEYGACGIPVICSDVECYRGDLPVTRVKNRHIDWVNAIRMHLADPDASARMGRELQQRLRQQWMLEGDNIRQWADVWTPG